MATLKVVQPIDLIDEGRIKLNDNDVAMNNEIAMLNNLIQNHNHDSIYYTKSEVDSKLSRRYLQAGLNATSLGVFAQIGGVQMTASFGIPIPRNCSLVDIVAIHESGRLLTVKNNFPLTLNTGDVISIAYTQHATNEVIRVYRNGVATDTFVVARGTGGASGLGKYILLLVFEF